jgi:hypothetical protein
MRLDEPQYKHDHRRREHDHGDTQRDALSDRQHTLKHVPKFVPRSPRFQQEVFDHRVRAGRLGDGFSSCSHSQIRDAGGGHQGPNARPWQPRKVTSVAET